MDSAFIHQAANELVQNAGTRNIKQIARSCSLDISETSRIKDMLGLLSLYFDKPLILINRQLNKQTTPKRTNDILSTSVNLYIFFVPCTSQNVISTSSPSMSALNFIPKLCVMARLFPLFALVIPRSTSLLTSVGLEI